jgi:hypothetical protein
MRGADSVSLIARLPWWRSTKMQVIEYRTAAAENQVMAAAAAWLATRGAPSLADADGDRDFGLASADRAATVGLDVADAAQANTIDLAAAERPPPIPTFLQSLLAVLGGALAAAVSARFFFA